jgi:GR25 family glycosyltransferase involved in LPS biosynthesis
MDHSITRKERMELDFGGIWDLRRNPAVDGGDLTIVTQLMGQTNYNEIAPFISEERSPGSINRGELGCVLSHLTAVKRAYLEGNEMAMIVEDDITPLLM